MPYVFIDEENYDEESMGGAADVVERAELDTVLTERDELRVQRDDAVARVDSLTNELNEVKDRYARHVISGAEIRQRAMVDTRKDSRPQSFDELFSQRTSD